jgi:hypothetical protein
VFAEWAAEYDRLVNIIHRAKLQITREKNMVESKARFQSFKRSREAWWLKRLGPVEFYARRLDWLYSRGKMHSYDRLVARLRAEGLLR